MKSIVIVTALAGLLLGLATISSSGQQEGKEKPLPITKKALLGEWKGKSGNTSLEIDFGEKEANVKQEDRAGAGKKFSTPYKIGDNVVKLGSFAEGRLLQESKLKVTFL